MQRTNQKRDNRLSRKSHKQKKKQRKAKDVPMAFKKLNIPGALGADLETRFNAHADQLRAIAARQPQRAPSLMEILTKHHRPTGTDADISKAASARPSKLNSEIDAEKRYQKQMQQRWKSLEEARRKVIREKNHQMKQRWYRNNAKRRKMIATQEKERKKRQFLDHSAFLAAAQKEAERASETTYDQDRRKFRNRFAFKEKLRRIRNSGVLSPMGRREIRQQKARDEQFQQQTARDILKAEIEQALANHAASSINNNSRKSRLARRRLEAKAKTPREHPSSILKKTRTIGNGLPWKPASPMVPSSTISTINSTKQLALSTQKAKKLLVADLQELQTRVIEEKKLAEKTANTSIFSPNFYAPKTNDFNQLPSTTLDNMSLFDPPPLIIPPQVRARVRHALQEMSNTIKLGQLPSSTSLIYDLKVQSLSHRIEKRKKLIQKLKERQEHQLRIENLIKKQFTTTPAVAPPKPTDRSWNNIKDNTIRRISVTSRLHDYLFETDKIAQEKEKKKEEEDKRAQIKDERQIRIEELEREVERLERVQHQHKFQFIPMRTKPLPSDLHNKLAQSTTDAFLLRAQQFPQVLQNTKHPLFLLINDKLQRASLPVQMQIKNHLETHVNKIQSQLFRLNKMKIFQQEPPKVLSTFQRNNINSELAELRRLANFTPLFGGIQQLNNDETIPVYFQHDEFIKQRSKLIKEESKVKKLNNRWKKSSQPTVNFYQHQLLKNQLERITYFKNRHQSNEQQWLQSILVDGRDVHWNDEDETWWKKVFSWSDVNNKSKNMALYEENLQLQKLSKSPHHRSAVVPQGSDVDAVQILPQSNDEELFISAIHHQHSGNTNEPNVTIIQEEDDDQMVRNHPNAITSDAIHGDNILLRAPTTTNSLVKKVSQTLHFGKKTIKKVKRVSLFERTLKYIKKNCQLQPLPGEVTSKHLKYDISPFLLIPEQLDSATATPSSLNNPKTLNTIRKLESRQDAINSKRKNKDDDADDNREEMSSVSQTLGFIQKSNTSHHFAPSHTRFGNVGTGLIDGFNAAPVSGRF